MPHNQIVLSPADAHSLPPAMLSREEVATILQLSVREVDRLLKAGAIPSARIGRLRRIHPQGVADYINRIFGLKVEERCPSTNP